MNVELERRHLEQITDEHAVAVYHLLCEACDRREGGMDDASQMIVYDIAMDEQIKQRLIQDINERGIGQTHRNGRQTYYQENKSIGALRGYQDQQRKLLAELRLTPSSTKAAQITVETDEFTDF